MCEKWMYPGLRKRPCIKGTDKCPEKQVEKKIYQISSTEKLFTLLKCEAGGQFWAKATHTLELNIFIVNFYCILKNTIYPLMPSTTSPYHLWLHPWGLVFPFCSILPPPHPPPAPAQSCQLVSTSLVSSACLLDSTYEWIHTVFVFLWLACFT